MTQDKTGVFIYADKDVQSEFRHRAINGHMKRKEKIHGALSAAYREAMIIWMVLTPEERQELITRWENGKNAETNETGSISQTPASRPGT